MPQTWSPDGVRQERTNWRDQRISAKHRAWGFNCPCADLDFLLVEYNFSKPVALIEYKLHAAFPPSLHHPTYIALADLADNYKLGALPFLVVFYYPDIWAFRTLPVNEAAKKHFGQDEVYCEFDYVRKLYGLRNLVIKQEVLSLQLSRELPVYNLFDPPPKQPPASSTSNGSTPPPGSNGSTPPRATFS